MSYGNYNKRSVHDLCLGISVLLLIIHIYYYCSEAFWRWGWMPEICVGLLEQVQKTGLFATSYVSKLWVLLFVMLWMLGPGGGKGDSTNWRRCVALLLIGLAIYFGSSGLFGGNDVGYLIACTVGYVLILMGVGGLPPILGYSLPNNDPFGDKRAGFPQEQRKLEGDFALQLPAQYVYRGRKRRSWVNIVNARRGVLIVGSPGSGKSWFIIEPLIRQLMEKGMTMFLYDFKYDSLSRLAYNLFLQNKARYPPATRFYMINFTDLSRSHRCNFIHVDSLRWLSDAFGVSRTLLYSLNKTWIQRQGEFFIESPVNFVAALLWFLRKYQDGKYCTLPHVIELAQVNYEELFSVLSLEPEVRTLINPFVEAYKSGTMEMLDGQVSSAKIPLGRLASPDVYYILTGHDLDLVINDPAAPKILCLGGDPRRMEALGPVLSLYIDQVNKQVNAAGRCPCALVYDEFGTVRAYSTERTIATARGNNIITILAIQDLNQLRTQYTRQEADELLDIAGNVFCGQIGGEMATRMSQRFPKVLQEHKVVSINSNDTSVSRSQQWTETITTATIAGLSSGEFVGVVADDPGQEVQHKGFHAKLLREEVATFGNEPLPIVRDVTEEEVMRVYMQVKTDIAVMISAEMVRMAEDPDLEGLMVRKG